MDWMNWMDWMDYLNRKDMTSVIDSTYKLIKSKNVTEWVCEWLSVKVTSREAIASKNEDSSKLVILLVKLSFLKLSLQPWFVSIRAVLLPLSPHKTDKQLNHTVLVLEPNTAPAFSRLCGICELTPIRFSHKRYFLAHLVNL